MRIIDVTDQDKAWLANISQEYRDVSQMDETEREFLAALIREKRPSKVLEVGVASGSSSVVILNTLSHIMQEDGKSSRLYSLDYTTELYTSSEATSFPQHFKNDKKTGHIVDQYPHLSQNWQLFTGGLACNFLEAVGGDIDFCLLDTAHRLPGEVLDFLLIFPYLRENATLVLHDTNLQMMQGREPDNVNNMLMSALSGTKLVPRSSPIHYSNMANISGVELKNQKDSLWDIFNLLSQHWVYMPDYQDLRLFGTTFAKHYDPYFVEMFQSAMNFQKIRVMSEKLRAKKRLMHSDK